MSADVVQVEGVVKDFRTGFRLRPMRVLDGVSFEVREGEIFGFVGPNGAGKTTTLKILMGLIHPTEGRASVLGHDVRETRFRRQIGFLPENPWFYDFLTGSEFLRFYGRLSGLWGASLERRVDEVLHWVHLEHAAGARLRTYSKGMLQRIGLAQALVNDPRIVFLDEPMSGLDPIGRVEIRDLILRLRAAGKTVFMNTHILSDVESVCDRVAIIVRGRVRHQGSIASFLPRDRAASDVVLTGVPPKLAARLDEGFDARVTGQDERIAVRVPDKRVDDLLAAALQGGARVLSVMPVRPSLESILLDAVQEDGR